MSPSPSIPPGLAGYSGLPGYSGIFGLSGMSENQMESLDCSDRLGSLECSLNTSSSLEWEFGVG